MVCLWAFDCRINFLIMFIIVYTLSLTCALYYTWNIMVKRDAFLYKDASNERIELPDDPIDVNTPRTCTVRR